DRGLREVVHLPAGTAEPELQVDLLRVEEELLVERPDLLERLTPEEERGARDPVDRTRLAASRLLHARLTQRHESERTDERGRETPGRVLAPAVGIHEARPESRDARMRVEVR